MFGPAIDPVVNVLSSAAKATTVRRVVVTSSVAALVPVWECAAGKISKDVVQRMYRFILSVPHLEYY
jgi:hypothetical protein